MKTYIQPKVFTNTISLILKNQAQLLICTLLSVFTHAICTPVFSQNSPSEKTKNSANKAAPVESNNIQAQIKQTASRTLKTSTNSIWFEKNDGQFGNPQVMYGFRTSFGSMGVYKNKLRVATKQTENGKDIGQQIVDISFPGSLQNWSIMPGKKSDVKGSYNTKNGTINAAIFNEITLKNVYPNIDLRLYSGEHGDLEFDWLVARAADYKKIRMNFTGQDGITIHRNGDIVLEMKQEDMKIMIPETYQVIGGKKKLFDARMSKGKNNKTLQYEIAGNIEPNLPLVIDPVMIWSTYIHNNTNTFDEYLYTIAVNTSSEVYACGVTNEAISTAYMSGVTPGFLGTFTFATTGSKVQSVILYRLNPKGTIITAWTYTGQTTNVPVDMGIFPDNRILVIYKTDTIQIFSADLTTRLYNDVISARVATNVSSYQSQAIINNDEFYLGGVATSALPPSIVPGTSPDNVISGDEGIILRIINASTAPSANWGTYVGGTANESFTAIAATPDKTKIAFSVHVDGVGGTYPALVNAVDNTIAGTELLVGVIQTGRPTSFNVFSYLGGSADEGTSGAKSAATLVAADNNYFYAAGNTLSTDIPGTVGSAQTAHGANTSLSDQFLSQIPLNGSAGSGFISTYNGGDDFDIVGGLVIDYRTNDVLLFGTTQSLDFPVYNASAYSPFYQGTHGATANGKQDITYSVFANGLASRKFSTFIGGSFNDYLGSTGKLQGAGHFQYNATNGLTYIGTTIHSDQATLPPQWMSSIPGFDKSIPMGTTSKDNHFIFAMNPNTDDFGDAPATYDAGIPASSAVSFFDIRIGDEADAEQRPNSSILADGDDNQNYGSLDDEDGVFSIPSITTGDVTYSITVSVYNNTGAAVNLCGWIDSDGNGVFDTNEFATANVPSSASQQFIVLNFSGLPPFTSSIGYSYIRFRIANVTLTSADVKGYFGKGEVEDYLVLQTLVLPVSIQKFTAIAQAENALVSWKVSDEINVKTYHVEHSTDNAKFNKLCTLNATGNHDYNWVHTNPITGVNFYRLHITSAGGVETYSAVQAINFSKNAKVTVYPNPAKDIIIISLPASMVNEPASICLYSMDGRLLFQKRVKSLNLAETLDLSRYPEGKYILNINTDNELKRKKLEVLKQK
jgi:hypothetical protein